MATINVLWDDDQYHQGSIKGTDEVLKGIVDFPGFYVSSEGRVFSAWVKGVRPIRCDYDNLWEKKQFLVDSKRHAPYWHVRLQYRKAYKTVSVHRLVALHFIPNPKQLPVVHHKKYPSNRAKDLMWATQKYNCHVGDKTKDHLLRQPDGELFKVRNLKRFCEERGLSTGNFYVHGHDNGWRYLGLC